MDQALGRFRALFDSIDGIVWEFDLRTSRVTFVSRQAERLLGYPRERWLEDPRFWVEQIHPDDRRRAVTLCRNATIDGKDCRCEYRMIRADGSVIWVRDFVTSIAENGAPARLSGVMLDVTGVKQTERELRQGNVELEERVRNRTLELRESERRFRMLAEFIPQVFWIITPSRDRVDYISPAYEDIWQRSAEELFRNPLIWTESIHPDDRPLVTRAIENLKSGKYSVEYRIVRPDGNVRWIRDRGFPVHDERGELVYMTGLAEDITERKAAQEALRLRELAAHLQSAREDERKRIAREIQHELGQSLTGLKLQASSVASQIRCDPDKASDRAAALQRMIDHTIRSVNRIASDVRPEILDLDWLAAVRWQADAFESQTGIPCKLDLPRDELPWRPEHSTAMFRILQESLTNVALHARAKSVSVRVRKHNDEVLLEVADDGKGISTDKTSGERSFGLLGMRERARFLGGTLKVEGVEGKGTTVSLCVPF